MFPISMKNIYKNKYIFIMHLMIPFLIIECLLTFYPDSILPFTHHRNWGSIVEIENQIKKTSTISTVILGSSSTLYGVSKDVLSGLTDLKPDHCIQAAMPGSTAVDALAIINNLIPPTHLKWIIFGFDNSLLKKNLPNRAYFLGLFDFNQVYIRPGFNQRFFRYLFEHSFKIVEYYQDFKYNFYIFRQIVKSSIKGKSFQCPKKNLSVYDYHKRRHMKFPPLDDEYVKKPLFFSESDISMEGKQRLKNFMDQFKQLGCNIIFVRIPMYSGMNINMKIDKWIRSQTDHQIFYINPRESIDFKNSIDFYNKDHMSETGMNKVTALIADFINKRKEL